MMNNKKVAVLVLLVVGLFTGHSQKLLKLASQANDAGGVVAHGGATCT